MIYLNNLAGFNHISCREKTDNIKRLKDNQQYTYSLQETNKTQQHEPDHFPEGNRFEGFVMRLIRYSVLLNTILPSLFICILISLHLPTTTLYFFRKKVNNLKNFKSLCFLFSFYVSSFSIKCLILYKQETIRQSS